LKYTTV